MLAAATGSFVLAVLAFAGDKSAAIKTGLNFYRPTGALSGVTTVAILVWLVTWGLLEWRWRRQAVSMGRVIAVSLTLLILGIALIFPPIVDLL